MDKIQNEARYYRNKKMQQNVFDKLYVLFRTLLVIGISFIIIYPIIQKIAVAFKDKSDIYNPTIYMIPVNFTWENVQLAIGILDYFPMLGKTLLFVMVVTVLTAASCALAGYGFARFDFPGNGLFFGLVVVTILIPTTTLMLPYYIHFKNFDVFGLIQLFTGKSGVNLLNTYWPSIITSATAIGLKAGLFIYIFRQFFKGLPKEIEEASLIDGAGGIATFFRIMLPNAIPPIITVVLFCFVWQYNDTFYTTLFMSGMDLMSLKVATLPTQADQYIPVLMGYSHSSGFKADPNHVAMVVDTGILLAIIPLLALYLVVQRYFVESIERSGIVG